MTMIERVGAAILAESKNTGALTHHTKIEDRLARAAVAAMREPTPEMVGSTVEITVGYDDFACGDGTIYMPYGAAAVAWQAMIDAALTEKETI